MIYLTANGFTPGGSSTVHIYTQKCIEQHNRHKQYNNTIDTNNTENNTVHKLGRVRAMPRLCEVFPGIYLTTEEKARKNLSRGSRRMPVVLSCTPVGQEMWKLRVKIR